MVSPACIVRAIEMHCHAITSNCKSSWLEIWAEDAIIEDPVGVSTYVGREALGSKLWTQIEAISPISLWLVEEVIVCGKEAVAILNAQVSSEFGRKNVGPIVDHFVFRGCLQNVLEYPQHFFGGGYG